jgi:uncharacterized Tic20 family protein
MAELIREYRPNDHEAEVASNSYLMSFLVLLVGMPLPIINLIASVIFYIGNRKSSFFIRWHCTQALLSQLTLLIMNSAGFWWTIHIVLGKEKISSNYIAYILTILIFNIAEFVATIYSAIKTRKGQHVEWWFYGPLANIFCKP